MKRFLGVLALVWLAGSILANEPPRLLSGHISDERGELLPYANILIKNSTHGTSSDGNGNFMFTSLSSGRYTIVVRYAGFVPVEQTIDIKGDTVVNFTLKEDALNLNEVTVTGTRTPKLLKDAPVVTRVISTDEIRRVNATTVKDLLEVELPGLEFTRQMDGQTAINMQGMGGKYLLFLIDGERMAGETLNNVDYNRLNADNIERIEIVKGAASALYGSSAIGGVVNIITRDASKPWSVAVNGQYGSNNEQRYGATIGLKRGNISSLSSATYKRKDTYLLSDTAGKQTNVNGGWDYSLNEKLTWNISDRVTITGKGGFYTRSVDNYENRGKKNDLYRNYNGSLRMSYLISEKQQLELSYLIDRYNKYDQYARLGVDSLNYRNSQHTARAQYGYSFRQGNSITAGMEFFRDELMSYQFDGNSHDINDYILYAQHDFSFARRFSLLYGVRMDCYSSFGANLSPDLSLMYKLNPLTIRGSYARGFRAPSLKEMYTEWDMGNQGWFIIKGDPNLSPEVSDNFTLSAEYARDRVSLSVTGYYNKISDKIATIYNANRDTAFYSNIDRSSIAGLDANLAMKCPFGVTVKMAYAYVHEDLKQNGVNISSTRPHSATLGLNYEFERKNYHLNVALNGRFLGKLDTNEANNDGSLFTPVRYPGYQTWKLVVTQRLFKAYSIQATVDNLFNYKPEFYAANSSISPGTTFMVGVSVQLDEIFK